MTADLIARLIAGPGSRDLDAEVQQTRTDLVGLEYVFGIPEYTTSLDAAVAFAVAVLGAERARYLVSRTVYIQWDEDEDGQTALDALPRHIVAEVLKARGDD